MKLFADCFGCLGMVAVASIHFSTLRSTVRLSRKLVEPFRSLRIDERGMPIARPGEDVLAAFSYVSSVGGMRDFCGLIVPS